MSHSRSALRLRTPYPILIRAVRGEADQAVVITQDINGLSLSLWNGFTRELRPVDFAQVTYASTTTTDGAYILDLHDPTGSEVGHLHAFPIAGGTSTGAARDLTPGRLPYSIRGLDCALNGRTILLTIGDDDGFSAVLTHIDTPESQRVIFHSPHEAWSGILSADAELAAIETTSHNPGVRRFAVTVVDVDTAEVVATLSDGPLGPVRPVRFAQQPGDQRLLVTTEVSGFARPAVWNPISGERTDVPFTDLVGDVVGLDWHSATGRLLVAHVNEGIHELYEHDLNSGESVRLMHPAGSFFEPDTGAEYPVIWSSYYAPDGTRRLVRGSWDAPLEILESSGGSEPTVVWAPRTVPPATALISHIITSSDQTRSQLWVGVPANTAARKGTILEVHGGPNLVTVDRYDATAQAWIDDGWVYASLNYRGSVTFGREFREKYWGRVGQGEIEDIAAAVDWLEQHHLAARESLFITGASYGGFLTLMALGTLPDRFAGGLAHVALADWVTAYDQMSPPLQTAWRGFIGSTYADDPQRWRDASPISYVESLRAPVWLNQGEYDTRTPPKQAAAYAQAVKASGGDALLDWFPGGHLPGGLAGMANDYARMQQLTARALQGQRWDSLTIDPTVDPPPSPPA
ncbi:MAG: prolyl oligopeptidase family serine peptidase [Actinomycetes bacterium]